MTGLVKSILIVEDNPMDLDLAKRAFSRHKALELLEVACDGEEALSYVKLWEAGKPLPALILLDLKLPKMGGLEVLRFLRAHPQFGNIPVVVFSTSSEQRDILAAYDLGANSYIIKPVNFERFVEMVSCIIVYWCGMNTLADKRAPGYFDLSSN